MLSRRTLISTATAGLATTLCAPAVIARGPATKSFYATPDDKHPIFPVGPDIVPLSHRKQVVPYANNLHPGAIVVDSRNRFLYVKIDPGRAMRYGVSVGK